MIDSETEAAGNVEETLRLGAGLVASDEPLHGGIEIRHTEGEAIGTDVGECLEVFDRRHARVDFDRHLGRRRQFEVTEEVLVQFHQGVGRVEVRGAPTPVVLHDPASVPESLRQQIRLGDHPAEVGTGHLRLFRHHYVAGAEGAGSLTEGGTRWWGGRTYPFGRR